MPDYDGPFPNAIRSAVTPDSPATPMEDIIAAFTAGDDVGSGLPDGGTTNQILAKQSDADGDADWVDPPADGADGTDGEGVPTGGTTGQLLAKNSNTDFDTEWTDPPAGGDPGTNPAYSQNVGDGTTKTFTITHGLGTKDVSVTLRDSGTGEEIAVDNEWGDDEENEVVLTFDPDASAPTADQYRVTVLANGGDGAGGSTLDETPRLLGAWFIAGDLAAQTGTFPAPVPFNHTITHMLVASKSPGAGATFSMNRDTTPIFDGVTTGLDQALGTFDTDDLEPDTAAGFVGDVYTPDVDAVSDSEDAGTDYTITLWGVPR
jgi:hypothetical protein